MLFLKLGAILGLFFFISKILFKLLQINVENYPSRNQHCDFAKPVGNLMNNLVNNDTAKQGSNPCYNIVLYAWAMFHFRYETNAQLYPMNFFIWSYVIYNGITNYQKKLFFTRLFLPKITLNLLNLKC